MASLPEAQVKITHLDLTHLVLCTEMQPTFYHLNNASVYSNVTLEVACAATLFLLWVQQDEQFDGNA